MEEVKYDSTSDTQAHIDRVRYFMSLCIDELNKRAEAHDRSKLESPEKEYFDKYTPMLANLTYGTPEYKESCDLIKPALDHHYANNRHHPQYFGEDRVNGMNLFDLMEMLMDWRASTERGKDGDIRKSLEINAPRHSISKQLKRILSNTIEYMNL